MVTKKCTMCKQSYLTNSLTSKKTGRCKACSVEYRKTRPHRHEKRRAKKAQLRAEWKVTGGGLNTARRFLAAEYRAKSGNKCCKCGYNEFPSVLEWHHRVPELKRWNVSFLIMRQARATLKGNPATIKKWAAEVEREILACDLYCPSCHHQLHSGSAGIQSIARREYLNRLHTLLGGICDRCGSLHALEFHHLDQASKTFDLSQKVTRLFTNTGKRKASALSYQNEALIYQELKKCILLCNNCHEAFHEGLWA